MQNLNTQMDTTIKKMEALLQSVSKTADGLQKIGLSAKQLVEYEKLLQDATDKTNGAQKERQTIEQKMEALYKRVAEAESREGKEIAGVTEYIRQRNAENRIFAKEMLAASNSIEDMRVKVSKLKMEWSRVDIGSKRFKELEKEIGDLNGKLSEHEARIGVYGRNVGNYASAFNPLQFQIQQVARELPSLTMSAQQFFLAISNNLPMLADELGRAQAKNEALRKNGEKTVPVWKQIVGGILSWQTALVVGITLMTAYGKQIGEWVKGLFAGRAATISMTDALKNMNEAMDFKDLGGQIADFKKLQSAWVALGGDVEKQKKFLVENREELDKTGIAVMDIVDAENLFVKNSEAYITALTLRAKAAAGMKLASEEYEKAYHYQIKNAEELNRLEERSQFLRRQSKKYSESIAQGVVYGRDALIAMTEERIKSIKDNTAAYEESAQAYIGIVEKTTEDERQALQNAGLETTDKQKQREIERTARQAEKDAERNAKALEKIRQESYKASMEMARNSQAAQAEVNKAIATDEQMSYEARKGALNAYVEYQKRSVQTAADAQIEALIRETLAAQNGIDTREQAEKELAAQIQLIRQKLSREIEKIEKESVRSSIEIEKNRAAAQIQAMMQAFQARANASSIEESNELRDAEIRYQRQRSMYSSNAKKMMEIDEAHENKRTAITRKFAIRRFDDDISILNEQLLVEGLTQEEFTQVLSKIGDKRLEYNKWLNEQAIEDEKKASDKKIAIEQIAAQKRMAIMQEVFEFARTLSSGLFDMEINRLDAESEAKQESADKEREQIEELEESGAISKEQADARKKAVDEQQQTREKELSRKRAELQKQQSIFEILLNTASAIMAAWTNPFTAPAIVPIIAATGATELALAMATPIPQYAQGTDNHPGGLAVVGDGGRPEVIATPRGEFFMTPAISTLVDLPAQSIVYPTIYDAMAEMPALPFKNIQADKVDYSKASFFRINEQNELIRGTNRMLRQLIYEVKQERERQDYYYKKSRLVHPKIGRH